jgi:NADH:ubiquinone oxidoreductase subunit D
MARRGRRPAGRSWGARRIRSHDFVNLAVLPHIAQGAMPVDAAALIGSIDIVLGSVDRSRKAPR